jgi:peptidoglycan-associated lipoprotein
MRNANRMLISVSLVGVLAIVGLASCAGKKKAETTPDTAKPPAPAAPPQDLSMSVDLTTPKAATPPPAPVPPADPCNDLRNRLASSRIHFEVDQSSIAGPAVSEIDAISTAIKASGLGANGEFSVEGHCDATGTDGYNLALSDRRAQTVRDRLVDLGAFTKTQARTVPWGEQRPIQSGDSPEAYAANRRVEIVLKCSGNYAN